MARCPSPDDPAPGAARRSARRLAARRRSGPAARRRGQSRARRPRVALGLGGPALLRGERDRAAPATVVHPHRPPGGARSVLPLRREQSRQHARPLELSRADRAPAPPPRCGVARADAALDPRVSAVRRPDRAVRPQRQAERRARGGATRRCAVTASGLFRARGAGRDRAAGPRHEGAGRVRPHSPAPTLLGGPGVCAIEPAPRHDHLRHDGHRRPAPALGASARHLSPELHPRVRPVAGGAPQNRQGRHAPPRGPRAVLHDLALPAAELGDGALALPHALRRRLGLPRRAGPRPPRARAPHGVLPPHLRGRRARRPRQRAHRPRDLPLAPRIPAGHDPRVCAGGERRPEAGRPRRPPTVPGAGGRRDSSRAGLLLREHRASRRHGLRRPRVRARLRPRHESGSIRSNGC